MRRGSFVVAAVVAFTLAVSRIASAAEPTPQDIAQARDLGGQALAAFEAGKLPEAEKLWEAAQTLYPAAPTLTLGLARTQAKLGKLVLAQESYNKIIREQSQATNPPPAFKDALDAAKAEVPAVSARIANVVITVEGGAASPQVTIDGQPVSAAGLGLRRPVDPGSHVVKAEAPGYKPAETSFQVTESGLAEVKLALDKAPEPPPAKPSDVRASVSTKNGTNKTLAIVALGVGGAGLVFGGVTGIVAIGKHGDLSDTCPNNTCPSTAKSDVDSYKTMGTLSTIGFIVGGVGVAAGAVLWFTAPKGEASSSSSSSSVAWHPYLGLGGGGVAGRF